uniref:VGF nerve growth factor inducible n=1 Tax=Latimeria chalumnae TaxID=7897 RepID=H3ADG5_LATCH
PSKEEGTNEDDDLFKDIDPKTLASVLLQALNLDQDKPESLGEKRKEGGGFQFNEQMFSDPDVQKQDEDKLIERVKSETKSATLKTSNGAGPGEDILQWKERKVEDQNLNSQDMENLQSMLQELQKYSAATKRERSNVILGPVKKYTPEVNKEYDSNENDILKELENFEELVEEKHKSTKAKENSDENEMFSEEKEDRRRKYFPDYEDMEIKRQTEIKKAEEQKIADIASDLLLQYLLKGEDSQEEENNGRSNEKGNNDNDDDDDDDIDPQTIDKLIEISSKLHLPADDVIDIINDVEKKKKKDAPERIEPRHRTQSRDRVKAPFVRQEAPEKPRYYPRYKPERPRYYSNGEMAFNDLLTNSLEYDDVPMSVPRRYRPKQATFSNYIRPRTFPQPRQYYYQPQIPLMQREDYYDESQDNEEELENYIEKILLRHPEVFQ